MLPVQIEIGLEVMNGGNALIKKYNELVKSGGVLIKIGTKQ
jgi:hypothetical protein